MSRVKTFTPGECVQCGKELPTRTYTSQGGRTRKFCGTECRNKYHGPRRPSRAGSQNYDRSEYLIVTYGITEEDYNKMLADQNGKCNICGSGQVNRGLHTNMFVDHCHTTGDIRGLLCNICNRQLAWLEHNWDKIMGHLASKKDL